MPLVLFCFVFCLFVYFFFFFLLFKWYKNLFLWRCKFYNSCPYPLKYAIHLYMYSDPIEKNMNLINLPHLNVHENPFKTQFSFWWFRLIIFIPINIKYKTTILLAIVLSVLLRYTDSDYPFGIFKLFLKYSVAL
jgi:hypothetical protein